MPLFQNAQILSAVQSAIVTDVSGAWVDLPGVTLNLTPGSWLVTVLATPRLWQSGVAHCKGIAKARITNSAATLDYAQVQSSTEVQAEQAAPHACTIVAPITVTAPTTIKAQGSYQIAVGGPNFASGFRWDSGYGTLATITAVRVVGL